jgi:transketolase
MFDHFKQVAPGRFFNCGIAEANMMSVAAGMALSGLRPVIYTIAPFTTTRCLEQIRVDVAYHNAPVVIVGTGSGLSYADLGPSHHSLEDMAILRSIPDINIVAPADCFELIEQLREAINSKYPTYMRIGKKEENQLHRIGAQLGIGKANMIREGKDILIIGVGPILSEALTAADAMKKEGITVAVASFGGVKPIDEVFLHEMAGRFDCWLTIEEHSIIGGVGSAIMEWLEEHQYCNIRISRLGVPDSFLNKLGNQTYIRHVLSLDAESIVQKIKREKSW